MTRKQLAELYNITDRTLRRLLQKHKGKLSRMATTYRLTHGRTLRVIKRKSLNRSQLNFIVHKVMGEPPEGYMILNGRLIKRDDE